MKNLNLLPTDKPSVLGRFIDTNNLFLRVSNDIPRGENVNIYITSDEEIKEGDVVKIPCGVGKVKELFWKFGNDNPSYIVEDIFIYKLRYGQKEGELQINSFRYEDVKKIILTTDHDLIKDGVQSIDDDFLEWFVKNPSCEKVDVKDNYVCSNCNEDINNPKYQTCHGNYRSHKIFKIIIPKEEPKQETLEEVCNKVNFINPRERVAYYNGLKNGAKWQQERMYSEEIINMLDNVRYWDTCPDKYINIIESFLKQFKKK